MASGLWLVEGMGKVVEMRALLSVSNKKGLVEFAEGLASLGFDIVSTGGTHKILKDTGLNVIYVSEVTGFPEILGGRVKTLHPKIHGGLLAKKTPGHTAELEAGGITRIDLLAVNLYPFEEVLAKGASFEECLENIDIGGPAMLRAAAKNHESVIVVCDPADYPSVLAALRTGVSSAFRRELAFKAFAHTASYDAAVSGWLSHEKFPATKVIALDKIRGLRYGENPHQQAALYLERGEVSPLVHSEVLQGKEMSYNNYADAETAWNLVSEFSQPACVAIKHQNPCGVAVGESGLAAYLKAYEADPESIFGGIIAFNRPVEEKTAEAMRDVFLEVVMAPSFEDDVLAIFAKKKNLRVLKVPPPAKGPYLDFKRLRGGFLLQDADTFSLDQNQVQFVTADHPKDSEWNDLLFAWTVVKHVRSNAIVIAKDGQTVGIGVGQTSRVRAARQALEQAGENSMGAVMASDAFFPFGDVVQLAARAGVSAIIQPGGSVRDQDSIDMANQAGIAMVFTGVRHFRH